MSSEPSVVGDVGEAGRIGFAGLLAGDDEKPSIGCIYSAIARTGMCRLAIAIP